jgi:hypothetical protein
MENKGLRDTIEDLITVQQQMTKLYCVGTPEYENQREELMKPFIKLLNTKKGGKKITNTRRNKKNGGARSTGKTRKNK